jgi:DNA-binding transcriptional ArsR family regulator
MDDPPDLNRLAEHLRVLANPNRLQLLYELRQPRAVSDIDLTPEDVPPGENPDRSISHQAVRKHLSRLTSREVVAVERTEQDGHVVDNYVLNHQRLFAIVEELRSLGEIEPNQPVAQEETIPATPEPGPARASGPRLVLVRGRGEGRVFEFAAEDRSPEGAWLIGRDRGLAVPLDYDPFVSRENTELRDAGDGFELRDLPDSRNGTRLNYRRLTPGEPEPLEHGDVITVGRTSLVFHAD